MPSFFVPGCEDHPELTEETYAGIKRFNEEQLGWSISDRRIFRVEYRHAHRYRGQMRTEWHAEVGQPFEFLDGEVCVAILEADSFLVCTPRRGVLSGEPVLVGQPHSVIEFD